MDKVFLLLQANVTSVVLGWFIFVDLEMNFVRICIGGIIMKKNTCIVSPEKVDSTFFNGLIDVKIMY